MNDTDLTPFERFVARYERNMHKPWNKPKTNADRIRAMSDEELAEMFAPTMCPYLEEDCTLIGCKECILKWLQQPADHFRAATKKEVASDVLMRPDGEEDA